MQTEDIIRCREEIFIDHIKADLIGRKNSDTFSGVRYKFYPDDTYAKEFGLNITGGKLDHGRIIWHVLAYGIFPDNSGRVMSHFIFNGTLEEIIEYFSSDKAAHEVYDEVISIDASIKNHD